MEEEHKQAKMSFEKKMMAREFLNRSAEAYLWIIVSLVFAARPIYEMASSFAPVPVVISERYYDLILSFVVFVFPVVFRLIFGYMPLEFARRARARSKLGFVEDKDDKISSTVTTRTELRFASDEMGPEELSELDAMKLFAHLATSSRSLSQSIYNRAGVYLLVGVFVAFSGLAFFYSQTTSGTLSGLTGVELLIALAPKFGILFFIEIVAFFFLRQYRAAMDEFRYFEAIKRNREETLALFRAADQVSKPIDPFELVKNGSFFSRAGVLGENETSEIIESRKLEKNELEVLEKVLDVVARSKK